MDLLTELPMGHKYQISLISESTGDTLDRIIRIFDIKKRKKK